MNRFFSVLSVNSLLRATSALVAALIAAVLTNRIFAEGYSLERTLVLMSWCGVVALLLHRLHWFWLSASIAAVVTAVGYLTVVLEDGDGADLGSAFTSGISDVVAAVWPSPPLIGGVAAITMLCCLAAMLSVVLATRFVALTGLLPSLGLIGLCALLASEAGAPSGWYLALYALAALAVMRSQSSVRFSTTRVSILVAVTLLLAAVPIVMNGWRDATRFDPRAAVNDAEQPDVGISPLARLDEWRTRTPANAVFSTDSAVATRWRLVGLTRYDGRTWMPADDYRRASNEIAQVEEGIDTDEISVTIGDLDTLWYPAPDGTVRISQPVRVDRGTSAFLAEARPAGGTQYQITIEPRTFTPAQLAGAKAATARSPFVAGVELNPQLLELGTTVTAGAQSDFARAERLATYLREQFTLDETSPAGHSLVVEELFLLDSRRGRDEQFVAAYALLAAGIGLPVRIAVGFDSTAAGDGSGTLAMSNTAVAWPEVEFEGIGWVPFDPLPTGEAIQNPSIGSGAIAAIEDDASVPPPSTIEPPPDSIPTDRENDEQAPIEAVGGGVSFAVVAATTGIGLLILAPIAYVVGVLFLKRRRRRIRAAPGDPRENALGAFRTGVDVLVDFGADASPALTDREVLQRNTGQIGEIARELEPLAALATEAVFRPQGMTREKPKTQPWSYVDELDKRSADEFGLIKYWRARLSLRSLRRDNPERTRRRAAKR